jgi:hypothetical protein
MPEQKGWTGLEPETPKPLSDLKQKKRRPAVFPFEVAGSWPKRAGWRPRSPNEVLLTAAFWPVAFPQGATPLPTFFCPPWPFNGNAPIKIREKIQRAWLGVAIFSSGRFLPEMGRR